MACSNFARWAVERIERLNVEFGNPLLNGATIFARVHPRWLNGLVHLLLFIFKEMTSNHPKWDVKPVLVCLGSHNNYHSASLAFEHREDVQFATFHNYWLPDTPKISLLFCYVSGSFILLLLPLLLKVIKKPNLRKFMIIRTDQLALTFGSRWFIRRAIKRSGAQVLILMSNLSVYHNLILEEASRLGICAVFATHAPVGRGQRALRTEYAMLDGEWQSRVYPPSDTKFLITGSARGEKLVERWEARLKNTGLIIATNTLMLNLDTIEKFILLLKLRYPGIQIALRPHPRDVGRHGDHRVICAKHDIAYNEPTKPLAQPNDGYKYLATALSGVMIDALLMGLYPLQISEPQMDELLTRLPDDYYGLHELDLVRTIDLNNPELPTDWLIGSQLSQLEKSAQVGWASKKRMNEALDQIIESSKKC